MYIKQLNCIEDGSKAFATNEFNFWREYLKDLSVSWIHDVKTLNTSKETAAYNHLELTLGQLGRYFLVSDVKENRLEGKHKKSV